MSQLNFVLVHAQTRALLAIVLIVLVACAAAIAVHQTTPDAMKEARAAQVAFAMAIIACGTLGFALLSA